MLGQAYVMADVMADGMADVIGVGCGFLPLGAQQSIEFLMHD